MNGVDQRVHNDCLRCAVATLLGLRYQDVPHFVDQAGPDCWVALLQWASERDLELEISDTDPGIRCIATGASPRRKGRSHAVVWDRGLFFDPHPSRVGLVAEPKHFATLLPQ